MQASVDRPRFRQDLVAEPIEDGGARFIDVLDPDSGTLFRFFEVEYSLACAMDGQRDVAGIQRWAEEELGLKATSPEGAFYTMLDVRELGDDLEIGEKCLQNRVVTVPGVAFGAEAKGFLRISFCNTEERMAEGVRRMKEALRG